MASPLKVIKNFMKSLNNTKKSGTAALNEAVQTVSNFSSWSDLINNMVADCKNYAGNATAFLKNMCGINLSNSDTGAITGSDAGGGSTKTASSIVPESGSWTYPKKTTFTINGLTVTVPKKSTLDSSEKYIVGGLYTWWIKNSLSLIKSSYGLSFKTSGVTVKNMDVSFFNSNNGQIAYVYYGGSRETTTLKMKINMHYFEGIENKKNSNGVGSNGVLTYLDRTIAHELTHAVMAANVNYFSKLPVSFKEGSAELVHGIDDKRTSNIRNLAGNYSSLRSAMSGSNANSYAAGYIALRYLAKQAAANRKSSSSTSKNVSANISNDELFQSDNFMKNDSSLDKIISAKDFSVANTENIFSDNFISQTENIPVITSKNELA